jgi:exoribonuclease R
MQRSGQRAGAYERAVFDLVEAGVLAQRVGEEFSAVVVSVDETEPTRGEISLSELGVEAPVRSDTELPLGTEVTVRLETADVAERKVEFRF